LHGKKPRTQKNCTEKTNREKKLTDKKNCTGKKKWEKITDKKNYIEKKKKHASCGVLGPDREAPARL
jgi:hypothetical protein